jgi:hypothetical protein
MPRYAKVTKETGEVLEYRDFPSDTEFADHKPEVWLPVREEAASATPVDGQEKLKTQVAADLDAGEVVRSQSVVALTAEEKVAWAKEQLERSDLKSMPRIVEDLIDLLIAKGVIAKDDLPVAAQDKINERIGLRSGLK